MVTASLPSESLYHWQRGTEPFTYMHESPSSECLEMYLRFTFRLQGMVLMKPRKNFNLGTIRV